MEADRRAQCAFPNLLGDGVKADYALFNRGTVSTPHSGDSARSTPLQAPFAEQVQRIEVLAPNLDAAASRRKSLADARLISMFAGRDSIRLLGGVVEGA